MPRPRVGRTRVAQQSRPQRVVKNAKQVTRDDVVKQLAQKPLGHTLANSDDSDDLVVATPGSRNRRGIPRREIYGSGGLGKGDAPQAHKKVQAEKKKAEAARRRSESLSASKHKGSAANGTRIDRATSSPLSSLPTPTPPRSILKKTSAIPAQPSSISRQNGIADQLQPTPSLAKGAFTDLKPRKRQPSLLAGLRQDATQLEDSLLNMSGLDEFDSVLPNDESTPLNVSKLSINGRVPSSGSRTPSVVAGRKRKITAEGDSHHLTESSSKRSSHEPERASSLGRNPTVTSGSRSASSRSPSLPRNRERTHVDHGNDDEDDEVNAPPQSSSSPVHSPAASLKEVKRTTQRLSQTGDVARPTRRKAKQEQSKMSTGALQALLPSRRQTKPVAEFDIPSDNTHDDEESYLPAQKLRKAKSGKDSTRGLVKPGGGKIRNAGKQASTRRQAGKVIKGPTPSKATPLQDASRRSAAKSSQQQEKAKVTYSSRRLDISAGDKENQPFNTFKGSSTRNDSRTTGSNDGDALVGNGKTFGKNMRKWADVDAFELDFEEVSSENLGGSSPLRI